MFKAVLHSTRRRSWLFGLALVLPSLGNAAPAGASQADPARNGNRAPIVCEAAVQHPI